MTNTWGVIDLAYPKGTGWTPVVPAIPEEKKDDEVEEVAPQDQEIKQDFHDTNFLPFPRRNWRVQTDEQFDKFIEVIQKLYINIPLLDAI